MNNSGYCKIEADKNISYRQKNNYIYDNGK